MSSRWIQAAFGDLGARIAGYSGVLSSVFDLALYPGFMTAYLSQHVPFLNDSLWGAVAKIIFVTLCMVMNIYGIAVRPHYLLQQFWLSVVRSWVLSARS